MEKPTVLLKKSRDFSDVINATFAFISQEFKNYGKVFLYYAGIPIVLAAIAGAFFSGTEMSKMFSQMGTTEYPSEIFGASYFFNVALIYLLSMVVYVFVSGLTAAYLHLYTVKGRNGFEPNEVWRCFTTFVWKLVGFYLLFFFGIMLFGGFVAAILGSLSVVGAGGVGSAVVIFFSMLIFLVLVLYVSVPISMGYLVIYTESLSLGGLFKRVFELVKGFWWQSFGVIIVLLLIYSIVGSLFSIPIFISAILQGVLTATGGDPIVGENMTFTMILVSLIGTLGQFIMYPIILIGIGVQYYSLREQKDNEGLLEKVAEMAE